MLGRKLLPIPEGQDLQGGPTIPIRKLRFTWGTVLFMMSSNIFSSPEIWDVEFETPQFWDHVTKVKIWSLLHTGTYLITEQQVIGSRVKLKVRKIES